MERPVLQITYRRRVECRLVGSQCREVRSHTLGIRSAVHGQSRQRRRPRQSLVAEKIVLTGTNRLAGQRVGEEGSARITASAGRRRSGGRRRRAGLWRTRSRRARLKHQSS